MLALSGVAVGWPQGRLSLLPPEGRKGDKSKPAAAAPKAEGPREMKVAVQGVSFEVREREKGDVCVCVGVRSRCACAGKDSLRKGFRGGGSLMCSCVRI